MTGKLNKTWYLLIALVFLCALGLRVYRAVDKETLYLDECMSIVLANYNEYGWTKGLASHNEWHTGRELNEKLLAGDNSLKGVVDGIVSLRESSRDTPHTNLYYSLLKLSFLKTDTSYVDNVIFRGVLLNVFFFILGFLFLFKLAKLLFPNKPYLIVATLAVAFLSPALIANTIFIRPYQLQETLVIIYTYLFAHCLYKVAKKERIIGLNLIFAYACIIALLVLSGYFLIPYVLILGAILLVFVIYTEKSFINRQVGTLFATFVISVLLVFLIYPSFSEGLTDYRGQEAFDKLAFNDFVTNASSSLLELLRQIKAYFMGIAISICTIILIIIALYYKSKKQGANKESCLINNLPLVLMLCATVWAVFVFFVAPFKEMRYIAPVIPIISLIFPYFISFFDNKKGVILAGFFGAIFLINGVTTREIYWGRRLPSEIYKQHPEIPLLVGGVFVEWMQPPLAPFFTDERKINFLHSPSSFIEEVNQHNQIFVLVHKDLIKEYLDISNYEPTDDIQRGDTGTLYRGYLLKRKKEQ